MAGVMTQIKNIVKGPRVRGFLETVTGCDIEILEGKSVTLVDRRFRSAAWYSYQAQVRSIFERFSIDLVIDAGANVGQFASGLRDFYAGEILSFEPISSVFKQLSTKAAGDPKWQALHMALGSENTTLNINVSDYTVFSSLLPINDYCAQRFGADAAPVRQEAVAVRRLDEVLQEKVPDLERRNIYLKMDTQGFDAHVFAGLGERVRHVRALQSEVSLISIYDGMPHWTEAIATYERSGFGVAGLFPVSRDGGRVVEYDCLMTRE